MTDRSHGSPYDRGTADSWYWRSPRPHWYPSIGERINDNKMTHEQIEEYYKGYDDNEKAGCHKDYD